MPTALHTASSCMLHLMAAVRSAGPAVPDTCRGAAQEHLASTSAKLDEAREQIQGNEHMIRWLNTQVRAAHQDKHVMSMS